MRSLILVATLALAHSAPAQTTRSAEAVPRAVTPTQLQTHLRALTADSMQGRGTGYAGDQRAGAYIAARFAAAGLEPMGDVVNGQRSWFQQLAVPARRPLRPLELLRSRNVIGLLPGRDPALRAEVVVIGAHYDGQGQQGEADMGRRITDTSAAAPTIFASANDNAAAVAALIAIAEQMSTGADPRPRRSVLFIAFAAEEHGLVGSLHYAAQPTVAWERHVAMLNLEMIGWEPTRDVNVRATATSRDWTALLDSATALTGVVTTRNQPELTNDTDHYGFGVRGLPTIHYGVGGSREHYHAVTDTEDRIAYDALAARTRHAMTTLRLAADRPTVLARDWVHPPDLGLTYVAPTPAEYAALSLGADVGAMKINAVAAGLPAAAVDMRGNDVIVAVNGAPWRRAQNGAALLRTATTTAADTGVITLTIIREGARRDVRIPMARHAAPQTEVVMLGTGTPNADPDRSGPAIAVVRGADAYLIDAGPGIVRRAAAAANAGVTALAPRNLRTLFLTHLHSDHTIGLPDVILSPWVLERDVPLTVYGPPGTKAMIDHLLAAFTADIRNRLDGLEPANTTGYTVNVIEITPGVIHRDSNVVVEAFAVPHGDWEHAFGYKFTSPDRSIVISGDTRASDAVVNACNGCDLLLHEVYSAERFTTRPPEWQAYHAKAHTSTTELAALATRAKPKQLVLYHQLYWGTTDDALVAEVVRAGFTGRVLSARDLQRY